MSVQYIHGRLRCAAKYDRYSSLGGVFIVLSRLTPTRFAIPCRSGPEEKHLKHRNNPPNPLHNSARSNNKSIREESAAIPYCNTLVFLSSFSVVEERTTASEGEKCTTD